MQKRAKRPAGAPDKALARPVTKVGIVGAGLMASQLALLFVRRLGVPVVLTDLDQARVDKGVGYVHAEVDKLLAKGRVSPDKANRLKALVSGSAEKADVFADADFVIEAVFEEMKVKKQVFADVEAVVSPDCILATNTSSLSITEMAADLEHPERVVGFHFFNPVAVMPLLEIVRGDADRRRDPGHRVRDRQGAEEDQHPGQGQPVVHRQPAARPVHGRGRPDRRRGHPAHCRGRRRSPASRRCRPIFLLSLVGPAIALHNSETLHGAFPDRFYVSPNLKGLVASGKTSVYAPDFSVDPEVAEIFEPVAGGTELAPADVRTRTLEALADEARRMLDEGVVAAPEDLDLAMITGAGFSFWNGGLTQLLDREGISERVSGRRFH